MMGTQVEAWKHGDPELRHVVLGESQGSQPGRPHVARRKAATHSDLLSANYVPGAEGSQLPRGPVLTPAVRGGSYGRTEAGKEYLTSLGRGGETLQRGEYFGRVSEAKMLPY